MLVGYQEALEREWARAEGCAIRLDIERIEAEIASADERVIID